MSNARAAETLRDLVEQIDRQQVGQLVCDALWERIPAMRELPADLLADVRSVVMQSSTIAVGQLAGEGGFETLAKRYQGIASVRAGQGIGVEQSLLAYEIGSEILLDQVVERLDELPSRHAIDVLALASKRILEHVETATSAVVAGYQEATAAAAADHEHRLQAQLALVASHHGPAEDMRGLPALGGIELPFRWCVASAYAGSDGPADVRRLRGKHPGVLVGLLDGRIVLYTAADAIPTLARPTGDAEVIGGDTAAAWAAAAAAADVAAHLGRDHVTAVEAAPLASLLALDQADVEAFLRHVVGPILDEPRADDLLDSLGAYLVHDLSVSPAARSLFVHRHTLEYRLRRVAELTGLDPSIPYDRFLIELALFLLNRYPSTPDDS